MRAAVYKKPSRIEITVIEKPVLKEQGAIIKIHGCGVCGSDIVKFKHDTVHSGTVLGHEIVGEIVEINSGNTEFKVGDRVVAGHHVPCFNCTYCKNESFSMCKEFKESNIIPGGFGEYIFVSERHLDNTVFKIPDGLSDIDASFTEPTACCLRAVKRANVQLGDNVLVIGLGSIGLIMGQVAKHFNATVIGCDILDERLELAEELEFDNTLKYTDFDETSISYKLKTNYIGADKVFLCSGSLSSLPLALACVRDGGTIVVFSSVATSEGVFSNNDIYYRELTVMGSYSPSPCDLSEALQLIKDGKIEVGRLAKIYRLDNINDAIDDTLSNKIIKAYISIL